MAEVNGDRYKNLPMAGEYGNMAGAVYTKTLAAEASGNTIRFGDIPGSAEIVRVTMINAAMGAGVTLSLGYRYKVAGEGSDALTAFFNAAASATAARAQSAGDVLSIAPGAGAELVGTIGGGAATGKITAIVEYIYVGQ